MQHSSFQADQSVADHIVTVTSDTFQHQVLDGDGPIVVEFMSYGCVHCRAMEPIVQEVASIEESSITLYRVNIGVEQELANAYEILGSPTFVMFINGAEIGRAEGPPPKVESLRSVIERPFENLAGSHSGGMYADEANLTV